MQLNEETLSNEDARLPWRVTAGARMNVNKSAKASGKITKPAPAIPSRTRNAVQERSSRRRLRILGTSKTPANNAPMNIFCRRARAVAVCEAAGLAVLSMLFVTLSLTAIDS